MIVRAKDANTGYRFVKAFDCDTRIMLQVRGGQTVTIFRELGEAQNQTDGIQLTQAATAVPYDCVWKGELWYSCDTAGQGFNILIIGPVGGPASQL